MQGRGIHPWRWFLSVVMVGSLSLGLLACEDNGPPRAPGPGSGPGGNAAIADGPVVDAPVDAPPTDAQADSLDASDARDAAGECILPLVCPTGSYCCVDTCLPLGASCNF